MIWGLTGVVLILYLLIKQFPKEKLLPLLTSWIPSLDSSYNSTSYPSTWEQNQVSSATHRRMYVYVFPRAQGFSTEQPMEKGQTSETHRQVFTIKVNRGWGQPPAGASAVEMVSESSVTQGRGSSFLEKGKVYIGQELLKSQPLTDLWLTTANSTATLPSWLLPQNASIWCEELHRPSAPYGYRASRLPLTKLPSGWTSWVESGLGPCYG